MKVAVLGASNKPERYSYQAMRLLREMGHEVYPVHPILREIDGIPVFASLMYLAGAVDTITVYVSSERSTQLTNEFLGSGARRVIFNPGAENPELEHQLSDRGVEVVEDCTLVMLRSGRF